MENLSCIKKLCRVCLCHPRGNDMVYLNQTHLEKIAYVGDSCEVRSDELPSFICVNCETKLDFCYDFVAVLNLSKSKLNEHFDKIYDPYRVADLSLETIDIAEESSDQFMEIVKMENTSDSGGELGSELHFTDIPEYETESVNGLESQTLKIEKKFDISAESEAMCRIRIKSEYELTNKPTTKKAVAKQRPPSLDSNTCHICKKEFSTRANMLRHVREHLGRRFVCDYPGCKSFFTQRSSLQVHVARHAGLKPYKCHLCCKSFSQSKSLIFHIRVHTGESPYECDYCNKAFKQKSNLVRHFKCHRKPQKQKQDRFKCNDCGNYLASKQSLIRHETRHERLNQELKRLQSMHADSSDLLHYSTISNSNTKEKLINMLKYNLK